MVHAMMVVAISLGIALMAKDLGNDAGAGFICMTIGIGFGTVCLLIRKVKKDILAVVEKK